MPRLIPSPETHSPERDNILQGTDRGALIGSCSDWLKFLGSRFGFLVNFIKKKRYSFWQIHSKKIGFVFGINPFPSSSRHTRIPCTALHYILYKQLAPEQAGNHRHHQCHFARASQFCLGSNSSIECPFHNPCSVLEDP